VAVMVPDMSESKILMMYRKELTEPLRGWVKAFKPKTLQDSIEHAIDLVGIASRNKITPTPLVIQRGKETRQVDKGKGKLNDATKRELRRKQLCFTCKESWQPDHRCMGKGKIHYIEVVSNSEDEEGEEEMGSIHNLEVN
jgi:hypothetical protein